MHFPYCEKVLPAVYNESLSYYEDLCKLHKEIEELKKYINNKPINLGSYYFDNRNAFYADNPQDINGKMIYISVNGDDSNDGLTFNTPVATVRRATSIASSTSSDLRLVFTEPGVYEIDWLLYGSCALHLIAKAKDVILNFKKIGIFYQTHLNIDGFSEEYHMKIQCENPKDLIYLDGGAFVFNNVDFDCTVRFNGAYGETFRTIFRSVLLFNSKWTVTYKTGFKNTSEARGAIYAQNSDIFFTTSNIEFLLNENDGYNFLYMRGGRLTNTQVLNNSSGFKYAGIDIGQSVFLTSNSSFNSLNTITDNIQINKQNTITNITLP